MKIGLLHISDIHIGKTDKNILEFIPKIQSACHFEFNDITKLYVVITGDIANTGNEAEYESAIAFLDGLRKTIKEKNIRTLKSNPELRIMTPNNFLKIPLCLLPDFFPESFVCIKCRHMITPHLFLL